MQPPAHSAPQKPGRALNRGAYRPARPACASHSPRPTAHAPGLTRAGTLNYLLGLITLTTLSTFALMGCGEERLTIDLQPVPLPEGGAIYSVVAIDPPAQPGNPRPQSQPDVIAPTHAGLFIHRGDTGPWEKLTAPVDPAEVSAADSTDRATQPLHPGSGALNFRPDELFNTHAGRLWVAPGALNQQTRRLLISEDRGQTWTWVPLPKLTNDAHESEDDRAEESTQKSSASGSQIPAQLPAQTPDRTSKTESSKNEHDDPTADFEVAGTNDSSSKKSPKDTNTPEKLGILNAAPDDPTPNDSAPNDSTPDDSLDDPLADDENTPDPAHIRFSNAGEAGFYLLGNSNLWRLTTPPGNQPLAETKAPIWTPVSLAGSDLEGAQSRTQLPEILRHYLPATPDRPFELLTVLKERIHTYRRDADQDEFKPTSSLDGADYQLADVPGTSTVLLMSSEGLFRSEDGAENWTRINWYALNQDDASGVTFQVLGATDEEPAVLLVALETGAIYRSEDLGETFVEVRPADVDHRRVSVFTYSKHDGRVWAATNGAGVLRSQDRGKTWQPINEQLRANRALDIDADQNDGFLLGSDAGLFRLNGAPSEGRWQMLQPRATTAINVDQQTGAILNGTTTGTIVRLEADGKSTASQATLPRAQDAVAYQAFRFRGVALDAPAIVNITATHQSPKVYAWSARRGPLISVDAGVSWIPLELNPAFENALEGSYISNFRTESNDRIYLVTHGLSDTAPTQLWRSYNNGDTWHAISSFPRGENPGQVFVGLSPSFAPETVFIAHHHRFARSVDGGNSWTDLPGPWHEGEILLYELEDARHRIILETRQTVSLVEVTDTEFDRPDIRTFEFRWPADMRTNRPEPQKLAVQNEHVFLSTDRGLLVGRIPDSRQRFPDGLALLVTLLSTFTLTLAAYALMRVALGRRIF